MSARGGWRKAGDFAACMLALSLSAAAMAADLPMKQFAIAGRIAGPADVAAWDYATIDSRSGRLFLTTLDSRSGGSYSGGVSVFDLRSGRVRPDLVAGGMMHKVVILGHGQAAVSDAGNNSVLFFGETDGRIIARVRTGKPPHRSGWHNPDFMFRQPGTDFLVAVNHDSGSLVLVDVARHVVAARIQVGGILEEATAEGTGRILVNVASRGSIAVVGVQARRVIRRIRMRNCEDPTGIAYDSVDRLVMSVCSNGVAKFIDPESGAELASVPVGKRADGIMYDRRRRVAFVAGGGSGTLTVIRIGGRHDVRVMQTLRIPPGTRLGAVDAASGRLFLPSAQYDLGGPRLRLPGLPPLPRTLPGTFALLVVARSPHGGPVTRRDPLPRHRRRSRSRSSVAPIESASYAKRDR